MPKKGYKQTEEHKRKWMEVQKRNRANRKPKAIPFEKKPPIYRDFQCATYDKCLANAARFDLVLDCTNCANRKRKIPKRSDEYFEMVTEDALRCCSLLKAVFFQEAFVADEEAKQKAVAAGLISEEEVEEVDWCV